MQNVGFITIGFVLGMVCFKLMTLNGDMNNDGQRTLVDLSILAEEIRNEP